MNKRQKLVQQQFLNNEKEVIKFLDSTYTKAQVEVEKEVKKLQKKIDTLDAQYNILEKYMNDKEKKDFLSLRRSKVYQKEYQEALEKQLSNILDIMHNESFSNISDYLKLCYEDGFIGTMYDLQGQGIPMMFPLDQEAVVRAVQLDSKIKTGMYLHLGEDVALLKKNIAAEISRGISTGMNYSQMALQIKSRMTGLYENPGGSLAYAMRIARTEGHRIQVQGSMDACYKAKDMGADVVKQWDSALDARTRESHQVVDGEIRELDEPFSNGLMFPGDPKGRAGEVINCRCALLQRAKWALDEAELKTLQDRARFYGLENNPRKTQNFQEFKTNYLKATSGGATIPLSNTLNVPVVPTDPSYQTLAQRLGTSIAYNPVQNHANALTNAQIIDALSGGDKTRGSCASVGLAYIGQKQGWNVLDFRDGFSRVFFGRSHNLRTLASANGIKTLTADGASSMTVGNRLLKQVENGKEYYLAVGRHASIVRKTEEGVLQYLELQSANHSGWTNFDGNPRYTLKVRFGCSQTSSNSKDIDFMIDITESNFNTDEFKSLLGYLNTAENEQRKGVTGSVK